MECIFDESLTYDSSALTISIDESKHLKALRLNTGDSVFVTNGQGVFAELLLKRIGKNEYIGDIVSFKEHFFGEINRNISYALGLLNDNNRMELAVEKITELGAKSLIPIISDYSQNTKISRTRLVKKSIAAMKQSKRSVLPLISEPVLFKDILLTFSEFDDVILSDENGSKINDNQFGNNILVLVGPEGGFSDNELSMINKYTHTKLSLGNRRLRAETSMLAIASFFSMIDDQS